MNAKEIKARFNTLVSLRKTVEDVWEVINHLVVPFRGDFFRDITTEHAVTWRDNREIFDSTAVDAANTLAASIHGSLTSPAIRWFELAYRDLVLNGIKEAREWLENGAHKCFLALQDSNFNLEANETYLDLVSYGTSAIIEEVEEKNGAFKKLIFQSVPVEETWFEQDHTGQAYRFYRRFMWTPVQMVTKFGDKVPKTIKEKAATPQGMDVKEAVVMCIYPRPNKRDADVSKVLAPRQRPFGMKYILLKDASRLGGEGGYYEFPAFIPRWRKTSKSMWGHGPAMIALPDILTINQLVELILKATEKVVDPATMVSERGLLSDLDLEPAGMTVVRDIEKSMKPYESGAKFDVSQLQRVELQRQIRSIFFVDQLELKESPAMTATEVQTRYELMQRLLGPTLGRLQSDYLDPLVQRTFNILYRAGELGEPPGVVFEHSSELDIIYTGPLVRAQRADIAQGVTRWVASVAELGQIEPEVLDVPDWDAIVKELGSLEGVPAKLMNSNTVIKKLRSDRKAEQAKIQEGLEDEQRGKGLEALGKGQKALEEVPAAPIEEAA